MSRLIYGKKNWNTICHRGTNLLSNTWNWTHVSCNFQFLRHLDEELSTVPCHRYSSIANICFETFNSHQFFFYGVQVTNYHVVAKLATDMGGLQRCKVSLLLFITLKFYLWDGGNVILLFLFFIIYVTSHLSEQLCIFMILSTGVSCWRQRE